MASKRTWGPNYKTLNRGWRYHPPVQNPPFFCAGCQKKHGQGVERTQGLDGNMHCERSYWRMKAREMEQTNADL